MSGYACARCNSPKQPIYGVATVEWMNDVWVSRHGRNLLLCDQCRQAFEGWWRNDETAADKIKRLGFERHEQP